MTTRRAQSAAQLRAATFRWRGMLCRPVRACTGCVACMAAVPIAAQFSVAECRSFVMLF